MSQSLPLVLLASLAAGGAGAAITTIAMPPSAPASTQEVASADMSGDFAALQEQIRDLSERLDAAEASSRLAPVTGAPRMSAGNDDLEEAVRAVIESLPENETVGAAAASPKLAAAVEDVLDQREERRRLEREQARAEAAAKRIEDRLAKLQSDLGLDQNQVDSMREIYQGQDERRDTLRDEMRQMRENGQGGWDEIRAMMTQAREETNTAIQNVLTPSQYESYQEDYNDDRWGRGGDRRGGGGDDGGGGGGRRGGRGGF